jgi:hypothetical protein
MELDTATTETATETLDVAAPAVETQVSTPAVEAAEAQTTAPETTDAVPTQEVKSFGTEAYKPSYKYKIKDSEFEFDPWIKPLLKDKDTEAKLRDLVTKSHGIEEIKKSREEYKSKLEEVEPKYKNIDASLNLLSEMVNKGDIRGFVEATKLPKEALLKYAVEELKYLQMPPEERAAIDSQRAEQARLQELENSNSTMGQQLYQMRIQSREQELSMVTSRPDVQTVVSQFNALVGKPDAFRQKVVEKGLTHYHLTGEDLSATQAVEAVLAEVGPLMRASSGVQSAGQAVMPQTQSGQTVVVKDNKPTIPNFQSGGVSPVKKQPKSLDDLRRLREQMNR